ncbi:hypothetical protein IE4872_CH02406 [Rhizobium gallicum]|uniref:Uncharacterized protein n=1 Tax=Rhizobium gallicum TaxID=56730 RepID=A0A1L5NJD6_9HYPH|nr:hypothetical protein IE4872_CH02406 [Rhizobium gallicum]
MTKRELIDSGTDKRYVRRDEDVRLKESVDVGKSLANRPPHEGQDNGKNGRR